MLCVRIGLNPFAKYLKRKRDTFFSEKRNKGEKNAKRWKPLTRFVKGVATEREIKIRRKKITEKSTHSQKLNGKEITWSNSYWWTLALAYRKRAKRRQKKRTYKSLLHQNYAIFRACDWTINSSEQRISILVPHLIHSPSGNVNGMRL